MKKNIAGTIALVTLSLFIGFSSIAVAEKSTSATSNEDQKVVTLPEIVCRAEKTPIIPEIDYRQILKEAMEPILESLGQTQLKTIMNEVKSIIGNNNM